MLRIRASPFLRDEDLELEFVEVVLKGLAS